MKANLVSALCLAACLPRGKDPNDSSATDRRAAASSPVFVPAIASPSVWASPVDLSTGVGRTVRPHLDIAHGTRPAGAGLTALSTSLSLKTWPELGPVASSVAVRNTARTIGADTPAGIDVTPAVGLADRWYAMVIDALPAGFDWPLYQSRIALPAGAIVTRFKTASAPMVVAVRLCDKPETAETQVVLALSERVLASADLVSRAVTISQSIGVDPRCNVEVQSDPAFLGTLAHACSALDPAASVSISLAPALSSATGKAIAPLNLTFGPGDTVDVAGCRVLRLYQGASASLP